ncbi:MAG: aspartate--tRNA ligase [bacterium]|nr:aspartate--tRNA ligase [bacterium]
MAFWQRTKYCGTVTKRDVGSEVVLNGWVQRARDHGGLLFVDIRDRTGIVQVVFNPTENAEIHDQARHLRSEFVVAVKGKVELRPAGTENPNLATGEIELHATGLQILNKAETPPFPIEDEIDVSEDIRLRYRYLDLRRPRLQRNFILRHQVCKLIRDHLSEQGFLEVETPMLTKSTPEGARDYLVPARLSPGFFFALPQSPQLFKQILMVAGYDRYFQIVRCFRDEDLRADRQPEFTQLDIEMSFVTPDILFSVMEPLLAEIMKLGLDIDIPIPFPRMTYAEAMLRFGSDKPDTRFGLEIVEVTEEVRNVEFGVFSKTVEQGGVIRGLTAPGCASFSRSQLDQLTDIAKQFGAKGLVWMKVTETGVDAPVAKYFKPEVITHLVSKLSAKPGDLLLLVADKPLVAAEVLGRLRLKLADELNLKPKDVYNFLWVTDFPLLEWSAEDKKWNAMHHPFTSPMDEDVPLLSTQPEKTRAKAYDLVLNGNEIGGGSIRIHSAELQSKMFEILGIAKEEAQMKFGFLLEAFQYGAPPHGGIAFGLDRILMIITGANTIRDVIAFPKTQKATCLMTNAPSPVAKKQLDELHLKTISLEQQI